MKNNKRKLLLVTGISGAGKTTAMNILEDMGYNCIDRYPSELIGNLVELLQNDQSYKYQNVALSIPLVNYDKYRDLLKNADVETILILVDADKETIIRRYKFTRRVHPLLVSNKVETLEEAIEFEKKLLEKYKDDTSYCINTDNVTAKTHREMLESILHHRHDEHFSVSFVSFGFKNGVPQDADFIFDVRTLDNPFYHQELKNLSGNDDQVYSFVIEKEKTQLYLKHLLAYLDFCFDAYEKEDKRHITVAIGCTGGQHRSVSVVNYLYQRYKDKLLCFRKHREVQE